MQTSRFAAGRSRLRSFGRSSALKLTAAVVAVGALGASMVSSVDQPLGPRPVVPIAEAPTTALAMAAAQRQGSPVEALDMRTEKRTVFAQPNGTLTAELAVTPVRTRKGDQWVVPDPSLDQRSDGVIVPKGAEPGIELSGGGEGTPLVDLS